jgi:hypothetical protein
VQDLDFEDLALCVGRIRNAKYPAVRVEIISPILNVEQIKCVRSGNEKEVAVLLVFAVMPEIAGVQIGIEPRVPLPSLLVQLRAIS